MIFIHRIGNVAIWHGFPKKNLVAQTFDLEKIGTALNLHYQALHINIRDDNERRNKIL